MVNRNKSKYVNGNFLGESKAIQKYDSVEGLMNYLDLMAVD